MDCKLMNVRRAEAEMLRQAHLSIQMEAHNYPNDYDPPKEDTGRAFTLSRTLTNRS